jgi:hypothetical protein
MFGGGRLFQHAKYNLVKETFLWLWDEVDIRIEGLKLRWGEGGENQVECLIGGSL